MSVKAHLTKSGRGEVAIPFKKPGAGWRDQVTPLLQMLSQYTSFVLIGLGNAVVDLFVLNLLLYIHPTTSSVVLVLDNTIAVTLAIVNSYIWNVRWTFRRSATGSNSERLMFAAQAIVNITLNNAALLLAAHVLPLPVGQRAILANNLAKLGAMALSSTVSFLLLRLVVFRGRAQSRSSV